MAHHVIIGVVELAGHRRGNRFELGRTAKLHRRFDLNHVHAMQASQEIIVPKGTAVLTIGGGL